MAKLKLTSAFCREITCPPGKLKEVYRCTEQTGFGIEVRPSNKKTYWLYYTTPAGKASQIKIGGYSDVPFDVAKRTAKELRSKIVLGGDPGAEKADKKATPRYAELARQHIEHAATYQRPNSGTEMIVRKYLISKFGKLPINAIQPQAIEAYLAELRKTLAPATVDKVRVTLNRSFVLAAKWGLPGSERNPVSACSKPRYDNRRERFLTVDEANRLLEACGESSNPLLKSIVHLLVLTGARKRELLDAKREHISIERKAWLIPDSKTGKARYVPLSETALGILSELPRSSEWLVGNPETCRPYVSVKRAWDTARKAAGLPELRIHDLRHSVASFMVNSGVDLLSVGKILGHADYQSTMRYSHLANDTLLAAVNAGANKMQGGRV